MAYFAPYLDAAGLHIPSYTDILEKRISDAQTIFGADIYLANDSQDYQYISAEASALHDAMQMCQLAINNQSSQTAVGAALDSNVKVNGILRNAATYSTCVVVLQGDPGTVIAAGVITDDAGYLWDMPADTTIGTDGTVAVTATCETAGAITADIGTLNTIATIQYGWAQVYNAVVAIPGVAVETDTALRARQSISVQLPSQTPLAGTKAAIAAIDGVTRKEVYENDLAAADANGIPAHSVAAVVEGGDDNAIATAIAQHKTTGCGTYGTTAIALPVSYSVSGNTCFSRPTYDTIGVEITVIPLTGYNQAIQAQIIANITDYLNTLPVGTSVQASSLYYPALTAMASLASPSFSISSIQVNTNSGAYGSSVAVAWNEVAKAGAIAVTGGY